MKNKLIIIFTVFLALFICTSCVITQEPYGSVKSSIYGDMILYDHFNIPSAGGGRQISKSYYYEDSVKIITSKLRSGSKIDEEAVPSVCVSKPPAIAAKKLLIIKTDNL